MKDTLQSLPQDAMCRVAMIGAGYMAREHLKAFADLPQVVFAGIMSRTRSRAETLAKEYANPTVTDSVTELAALQPDLVVITVNAEHVHELVQQCSQYPWTILSEKPVGLTLKQATETLQEVQRRQAKAFVALNRRSYASTRAMLERLETCEGPRFIEVFDQQEPERLRALTGKGDPMGLAFGNSIHTIDFLPLLGRGQITSITPVLPWKGEGTLAVAAALTFTSGDVGMYHAVWNAPGPWAVFVTTHGQRFELRPLEKLRVQTFGKRTLEDVELEDVDIRFKPGLRVQAEEAVRAALGLEHHCVSLAQAHKTMELIAAIYGAEHA
jgi:predicted dehydrogenase